VQDCSYHQHVVKKDSDAGSFTVSLINPTYLAFESSHQFWMVMKVEAMPEAISKLLPQTGPPCRRDFGKDLKPGRMKSDRTAFARQVMQQAMLTGLHWRNSVSQAYDGLIQDSKFFSHHNLVDYSLLMTGSVISYNPHDKNSHTFFRGHGKDSLLQAVAKLPQCGMECSSRERDLVDVTAKLTQHDAAHVQWGGQSYKCCCIELGLGESVLVKSPCALVSGTAGCGTLLGRRFHSYWRSSVGGRCLVRHGGVALEDRKWLDSLNPMMLAGNSNDVSWPPWHLEVCAVVCVALLDYLLPLSIGKSIENVATLPLYGSLKWSDYGPKVRHLFHCLADSVPRVANTDKSNNMLRHFLSEPHFDAERTANQCKDVFPKPEKSMDANVLESLVGWQL